MNTPPSLGLQVSSRGLGRGCKGLQLLAGGRQLGLRRRQLTGDQRRLGGLLCSVPGAVTLVAGHLCHTLQHAVALQGNGLQLRRQHVHDALQLGDAGGTLDGDFQFAGLGLGQLEAQLLERDRLHIVHVLLLRVQLALQLNNLVLQPIRLFLHP